MLENREFGNIPSKGPIARPSCPDDRNLPNALPFANSGELSRGLPVSGSTVTSSHCNEAYAVKAFTTVAEVNARQTADAYRIFVAKATDFWDCD